MSTTKKRQFILLNLLAALVVSAMSCNSKHEEEETEIAVTPALVAVKNFYLKANDSVMAKLDSVFFSIDLDSGVIFNADSLPKGTNVSKLVPSITFANSMTKAELKFKYNNLKDSTVNYLTNPDDTIDFTSPVILDVTAADGVNNFSYTIKVNVHLQDPDTIVWTNLAVTQLPSRFESPVSQKTVIKDNIVYCLIEEYNGEYTLSTSSDLNEGIWVKNQFDPGFEPYTGSLTVAHDNFYLQNTQGEIYSSPDLQEWSPTGEKWIYILGAYGDGILGVRNDNEQFFHVQYPASEGFEVKPVEKGFPIYNASYLGVIESRWADKPIAIIACGVTEGGSYSSAVWAYDGSDWAIINDDDLPPLEMPMMTRYVVYRATPQLFQERRFDIWLLFGGYTESEEMNRKVYMSYNNGVDWQLAPQGMQLPEKVPSLGGSDVIVAGYELSADLSDAWKKAEATRASYTIEGFDISWICPYLYIFGGYHPYPDNSLNTEIWRGVLQRLEFTPDI